MITWVMVGLLLAAETCGRNVLSGNGNGKEETKQKDGLKGVTAEEEDIYRGYRCRRLLGGKSRKKSGERAENGANRSMICSTNSSLSSPLESCNRAPLILHPGFLPLTDLAGHFTSPSPSANSPQIIPLDLYTPSL
ncbi:hypothetical protein WN48_04865 [Eufriesea mexicana]|uniref:Uncharacterized protein n=1 Tax=Eufriesea mexicana TaxID=516756 RepID=A0A310SL02_9HYME|nr:hypothetical protein WN48_04865 [Eufriesea mexicana]